MEYSYDKQNHPLPGPQQEPLGNQPVTGQPMAGQPVAGQQPPVQHTPPPPQQTANPYGGWNYRTQYQAPHSVSYQPEPAPPRPDKKKGGAGKVLGGIALVLACGVAGFGGGMAANSVNGNASTVVYKTPEDTGSASGVSTGEELSLANVAAKAKASVVSITTENVVADFMLGGRIESGAGSGIIISEDGTIITNHHVIAGNGNATYASNVVVTLNDGSEYEATVVGSDATTDIAVLKIDASGLTPAVLGDSDHLEVGEFCLAIGNPMGTLGGTVTDGIVSAIDREMTIEGQPMTLLQMSAAVSPGNSGGGLFDASGSLIGVVNAKSGGEGAEGLGFAIPVNTAMSVANELIANGYVTGRPALGINVITMTAEQAMMQGLDSAGVYIGEVNPGSAAEKAGLQAGDRIISADGEAVETYADLSTLLQQKQVGDTINIGVFRERKQMNFDVVLEEMGAPAAATE